MIEKFCSFLKNETYCVISTVTSESHSESAFVAFSENNDLEIMIGTSKKSRKFRNIVHNPAVSIVFGFDGEKTLQYEGVARVPNEEELEKRLVSHFRKHPGATKYQDDLNQTYIIIEPRWARISASGPIILQEMRFDSK